MSFDQTDHFVPDTWRGTPVFSIVGRNRPDQNNPQHELFEKRTRYFNYLPHAITIVERSGLCMTFPPLLDTRRSAFVIQTEWVVHRSLQTRFMQLLYTAHEHESKSIIALRECLKQYKPQPYDQWLQFRSELSVTQKDLSDHRDEIYDYAHDVVISTAHGFDSGPHPFSETGRMLLELQSWPEARKKNVYFETIRIVDNDGTSGDRFINRNSQVFPIKSTQDPTLESGVWVTRSRPYSRVRQPGKVGWQRYGFDEADQALELYKSYAEAKHYGDSETRRKLKLARAEARAHRSKTRFNEQKLTDQKKQQKWERKKAKIQKEAELRQAVWEKETAELKMNLERTRHFLEQQLLEAKQSEARKKDVNDWLKQMPAIVGAIALAWLTYKTAKVQAK